MTGSGKPGGIAALIVAVVTAAVYIPSLSNGFVNWDDPVTVINNPYIRSLDFSSLRWMFLESHNGNRIPLNWISHALVYRIGGLDPFAHHLTNLLFHCANSVLLYLLFLAILRTAGALEKGRVVTAAAGALFWAVHPAHVESVAWVTERKDVGGTLFFLLCLLAWFRFAGGGRRWLYYVLSLLSLVASLLFKPMAVTVPIVLLLLDWWPLGRIGRIFAINRETGRALLEKTPFLILSLLFGLLAIKAQAPAIQTFERMPADFRVMNALHSIVFYMQKLILPLDLAPLHPILDPERTTFSIRYVLFALLVPAITLLVCRQAIGGRRWPAVAWFAYVVTLGPVLGILQVGVQAAADRYTYIPSIALSLLPAAGLAALGIRLARKRPHSPAVRLPRATAGLIAAAGLIVLGVLCVKQEAIWKDSTALWKHQTRVYPDVEHTAYSNLAKSYQSEGRLDLALKTYRKALTIPTPTPAYTLDGLGCVLLAKDRVQGNDRLVDEAVRLFQQAAASDREYAAPHRNLWFAYRRKGMEREALHAIGRAIAIDPGFAAAYSNFAISLSGEGRYEEAEEALHRALEIEPKNNELISNLAGLYLRRGKNDDAITLYGQALVLAPRNPRSHLNMGNALEKAGRKEEAVAAYGKALLLDRRLVPAHAALARLYHALGKPDLARRHRELAGNSPRGGVKK
jgi:protein O-mannosyl-transferase